MKKYYAIVLFIFAFQLVSSAMTSAGVFPNDMIEEVGGPTVEQINTSTYEQMEVDTPTASDGLIDSVFAGAGLLLDALKMLVVVFLKTLVIYPTLVSYGVPGVFAAVFQGMNTVIQGLALLEFKTGRRTA